MATLEIQEQVAGILMVLFTCHNDLGGSTHGPFPFKMASKITKQDFKVVVSDKVARSPEVYL